MPALWMQVSRVLHEVEFVKPSHNILFHKNTSIVPSSSFFNATFLSLYGAFSNLNVNVLVEVDK